jgi:hypothetical protein
VAFAIFAGLFYRHQADQRLSEMRAVTMAAVVFAREALVYADSADARASFAVIRADSIEHARKVLAPARAKIVAAAPDTCAPAIAALEAENTDLTAELAERKIAYDEQKAATVALRPATEKLADASTDLVKATQPSFFVRFLPDIGVGAAVGISAIDRRPDAVIGITLSWEL